MRVFLVAGENSGDALGGKLIHALRALSPSLEIAGLGGDAMAREGLRSLFPIEEIAVNGFVAVARNLPGLYARIASVADTCVAWKPDVLVLIDAPDFTHRVARRVRKAAPDVPIVDYVSPSVWAWRPRRAPAMRAYVDHVLALFPFEPAAHERLGGPPCTFVGHPLVEHLDELRPNATEQQTRQSETPMVLLMPGSRASEIARLMPVFGETLRRTAMAGRALDVVLPAVPHLEDAIREEIRSWPVKPDIVVGQRAKLGAFRRARAALVASGTATLELALAGVPMVVAYKVSPIEGLAKYVITVPSVVLPNLILGENVVPEYLQGACEPEGLARALHGLIVGDATRDRQSEAFRRLPALLTPADAMAPSRAAAKAVLEARRP